MIKQECTSAKIPQSTVQIGSDEISYTLSDFILQNKIGSGSFGKVFKVKDKKTGKILVAKISIKTIEKDSISQLRSISQEVNILSKLNHPSVLKFIYYSPFDFKNNPKPVIVTEFLSNGSLEEFIYKNFKTDFNMTHKLIIIYGIAAAMSYLHSHNIIHRDLKPANILLDDFLFPKVADFGLSKNEKSISMTSMYEIKGTPIYMAPEIWFKTEYSKAGDVYAFGIIVYELMTNVKPFNDLNFYSLSQQILKGNRPNFTKQIPDAYLKLIQECWSQDPIKRPMFDQILNRLINDHGFITEEVNESDYLKYVSYINESKSSFDQSKNAFYFDLYNNYNNKIKIVESEEIKKLIGIDENLSYPYKEYLKLDEVSKKLVDDAKDDSEKLFKIGISLIEGREHFPQNTQTGNEYLQKCIENGFIESIVYYCKMLIKGKIIPRNLDKAKKIAQKKLLNQEAIYSLIVGIIEKKKKNYEEAKNCFVKSIQLGNDESMYEYGKMLYKEFEKEKAFEYFKKAIEKGNAKAMFKYGKIMKEEEKNSDEGNKFIKMSADSGNPKACYYYSLILEKGEGIEANKEESIKYLQSGAQKGHNESMSKYGFILSKDSNSIKDSLYFLKKSSDGGNMESIYQYGMLFYKGEFVMKNKKEAAKYLKIAAYGGNADAMAIYGDMLLDGDEVPMDKQEALKLFQRGIELDNDKAMISYANMNNQGNGIPLNKEEAIKFFKMAIDKGNDEAMNNYGYMFRVGDHVPVNKEEAIKYFKKAIEIGNETAMENYAEMLRDGEGIPVNKKEAIKYYKMAIKNGNQNALTRYIIMLQNDEDAESDIEEAISILKKAIDDGDSEAMNRYGALLYNGKGLKMNKEEGVKYVKMAMDRGNTNATMNYAIILSENDKTYSNKEEWSKYFKIAIEKGSTAAMLKYADTLLPNDKEEAIKYYKMAIDKGNTKAITRYAYLLYSGDEGIQIDKNEAIKYLKMGADLGNSDSMFNLAKISNDEEVAIKYLKMAVERGNDKAMCFYSQLICANKLVNESKDNIIKYFKMAINRGNIEAMRMYGFVLYKGIAIEMNKKEGSKYLKMAADHGDAIAALDYSSILYNENGSMVNDEIMKYFKIADNVYAEVMNKEIQNNNINKENMDAMFHYVTNLFQFDESKRDKSIKYLKLIADNGYIDAIRKYGYINFNGLGITVNREEAFKYFKKGSEQGDIICTKNCCYMLFNGCGVEVNKKESLVYFKKLAENGDANAMNQCAEIIFNGDGVPADKEEGIKYFRMAVEKGDCDALYNYGEILFKGDGIPQNEEEAVKYIKKSADMENPKAMYFYGTLLEQGKYVELNKELAIKYYIKSSNQGNLDAIRRYNQILDNDENTDNFEDKFVIRMRKIERRRSFSYIEKEKSLTFSKLDESCRPYFVDAEFDDSTSSFYVATSFIEGKNDFPKNKTIGIKYLEKSCKMKNIEAIKLYSKISSIKLSLNMLNEIFSIHESSCIKLNLAKSILLHESFDVNLPTVNQCINYKLAKKLSKESAEYGNLKGMILYGNICCKTKKNKTGEINCDFKEAFKYYKRASKYGDSEAMALYGSFLIKGIGCPKKNPVKAVKYFKKSYDKGNLSGYSQYGCSLIEGVGGLQKDIEKGLQLIRYAVDRNNIDAIFIYSNYLKNGLSNLEKNEELAFKYVKIAASMGHCTALNDVGYNYYNGIVTDIDRKESLKYFVKGFEEGSIIASYNLGHFLVYGDSKYGIDINFNEGMKYLKYASDNNNTSAIFHFSKNIANKKSTKEELDEMEYYLKKGVYLKDVDLIALYANILCRDNILQQDKVKAARYYKMSGDLGDSYGARMYAKCLSEGFGVEANHDDALKYLKMSADSGDIEGMVEYASFLSKGEEGSYNKNEVIKYFKMAVEKGEANAEVDLTEAKRYLEMTKQKVNEQET